MKAWLLNLWQAALLRTSAYERIRIDPDAFLRGFLVIIAVSLIAGLPQAVENLVTGLQPSREPAEVQTAQSGLGAARPWLERAGVPPSLIDMLAGLGQDSTTLSAEARQRLTNLPTLFARPLAYSLQVLGGWLSGPFHDPALPLSAAVLATWLGYGIWVMLFAKLLGGQASLPGFFGATALFALPHLLRVFGPVPAIGSILAVVAFIWGIVIYIKATAVSHDISGERALLAVVLPFLLLVSALLLFLAVLAVIVVLVGSPGTTFQ